MLGFQSLRFPQLAVAGENFKKSHPGLSDRLCPEPNVDTDNLAVVFALVCDRAVLRMPHQFHIGHTLTLASTLVPIILCSTRGDGAILPIEGCIFPEQRTQGRGEGASPGAFLPSLRG